MMRGCVIRSSSWRAFAVGEDDRAERAHDRAFRRASRTSCAETLDDRVERGSPGRTASRASSSASITVAPRAASIRSTRALAGRDAPGEADQSHRRDRTPATAPFASAKVPRQPLTAVGTHRSSPRTRCRERTAASRGRRQRAVHPGVWASSSVSAAFAVQHGGGVARGEQLQRSRARGAHPPRCARSRRTHRCPSEIDSPYS